MLLALINYVHPSSIIRTVYHYRWAFQCVNRRHVRPNSMRIIDYASWRGIRMPAGHTLSRFALASGSSLPSTRNVCCWTFVLFPISQPQSLERSESARIIVVYIDFHAANSIRSGRFASVRLFVRYTLCCGCVGCSARCNCQRFSTVCTELFPSNPSDRLGR